jgi:hypothetical protein
LADVVVSAGSLDRDHTIVTFDYPTGAGQKLALRDAQGVDLPVQVEASGVATFMLPALSAGAQARYTLVQAGNQAGAGATATEVDGVVRLNVGASTVVIFGSQASRRPAWKHSTREAATCIRSTHRAASW